MPASASQFGISRKYTRSPQPPIMCWVLVTLVSNVDLATLFSDKWNWLPEGSTQGAAVLWDVDYNKKPAYFSTVKQLALAA